MTNELVFLSKMDEGNETSSFVEFNISEIISDEVNSFSVLVASKNKKLSTEIESDIKYYGNSKMISELISILLDNAFKYSDEEANINVSLSKKKNQIILILSNTTNGIPKGNLDVLFDRFYRLDDSRNNQTGGHGLGLSIAKAIVELHKGKITAYSSDGKTIEFKIIF